ncbi:MAG TPA: hypothetical protein PKH97_00235 [Tetrasphaera sp.]|uniref:hypothetical protein n=1 Tax=Nostocoides sp. TaxID=1917966 RepID=UPI002C24502A|nr:hypothetical protein [Tetrasphaera sp.]HNQ05593.1 hypothetical protein [Tetrasphaera sp.]
MTAPATGSRARATGLRPWLFAPVALARVAWLRTLIYLYVVFDVLVVVTDPIPHGWVPVELYHPVLVRQVLHLPAPSPVYVRVLLAVILLSALVAATGRLPRIAGLICAFGMLDWISNAFSYSKIDHDHYALIIALFVLPTVGRARYRDVDVRTEAAGWAIRMIQISAVAIYFLSAWAKMRFGTWGWANGSTLIWALTRRPNGLAPWIASHPTLTHALQWLILVAESCSPALLWLRGRALAAGLLFFLGFHASTYYLLRIHFLPLVVCLFAFMPLERIAPYVASRRTARIGRNNPVTSR